MTVRPRRSVLYMPASNQKAIDKARTLPCDAVILDLEDAVAPEAKDVARAQAVEAVKAGGFGRREVIIRVNGLDTPWGAADLAAAALEDHWKEAQVKIDRIFAENHTPQAQLHAICQEILRKQKDSFEATGKVCGCPYATVGAEMSGNNEVLFHLSQNMAERFLKVYERILEQAAKEKLIPASGIKERAQEMQTYGLGAMLQARMTNTMTPVDKPLKTALFRIAGLKQTPQLAVTKTASAAAKATQFVKKR